MYSESVQIVSISIEIVPGMGEDAPPLNLSLDEQSHLLGVFDGMGGAGGTPINGASGVHSHAYYASRITRRVVSAYFRAAKRKQWAYSCLSDHNVIAEDLRGAIARKLKNYKGKTGKIQSKISSTLIKSLPTTMALCYWERFEESQSRCLSLWAGDSRCYLLNPIDGLIQLTTDDLKTQGDALTNLTEDSPMSNYVNADTEFRINTVGFNANLPCLLIAATDGCFGYLPSPMHFEHLLVDTLVRAPSQAEWEKELCDRFQEVAGDDVSLTLSAIGWQNFRCLRDDFVARRSVLEALYVKQLRDMQQKLDTLDEKLSQLATDKELLLAETNRMRRSCWEEYRQQYEKLMLGTVDAQ